MKRFLYYNQDSVNSLLAQIEQGLLIKDSAGEENMESRTDTTAMKATITGDLSAKVLGIGTSLKGATQIDNTSTDAANNLIHCVEEKVLHDYAFDRVYNHIVGNSLINNINPQIGDFILVKENPTFLDFGYFQALFADNGALKMVNEQNRKNMEQSIEEIKKSIPKGKQMPILIRQQIDEIKKKVTDAEPERREMIKMIEAIRNTLPYNRFVMTSNMLIPLDDENFRDNPDIVAFKYGGNMSIFGYVTNVVSSEETPKRDNDFAPLYDTVNQIMLSIFKNQKKIYIVHPVVLFY